MRLRERRGRAHPARKRRGATLVEFAIVAPLMLLFVLMLIELGRYGMVKQALTNAAREGSRTASLATTTDTTAVDTAVENSLVGVISSQSDTSVVTITVTPSDLSTVPSGTPIEVVVALNASDVSWLPGGLLPDAGRLGATSSHVRE